MPLSKGDPSLNYDGSWGDASKDWPSISFPTETQAREAYVVAWRDAKVPYGSYVLVDKDLRLETPELKQAVQAKLLEWMVEKKAAQALAVSGEICFLATMSKDTYASLRNALGIKIMSGGAYGILDDFLKFMVSNVEKETFEGTFTPKKRGGSDAET